ncbi:hypothetical protein IEQ34_022574 [Dendrobium chrysotoxum]|uniref:GIY-YIG homing endonuclease n=1 Tax=Dendrobium chrysotoxum TaxID=161865 RepID=A0AAV7FZD8_DENCH|nr:hypothetical protein IEQ34_022574 [Dendrobium chrysotoxum]
MLNLPDINTLHYKIHYLNKYVDEEYLFKVGLSTKVERSHAHMLKKSAKVLKVIVHTSKIPLKQLKNEGDPQASSKKKKGEYKKKYDGKIKEIKVVEKQQVECRAKLIIMATSASLQNQQMDRIHIELVDAQAMINQHVKDQQILEEKITAIEDENKRLQSLLSEKEAKSKLKLSPSKVIEEFNKSVAFKMIVQDQIQEALNHIYDVEVKILKLECMEEGFI